MRTVKGEQRAEGGRDESDSLTDCVSGPRGPLMQAAVARTNPGAVQALVSGIVANHNAGIVQESPDWGGRPFEPMA
ncbi:hypothetical protein CORC01_08193 [Colletotrichum orchidophilum]|uniref:Uncharacterized protein n=1 Tax=Colletotrichum orchidophilum TaxID=1209926 RepID=A0A1G4B4R3_9PEZI|nr:uncharacterized protein CORC01_08193 [Colletotrichum orchidophilum]OHE96430.1 hypothetical protein CORC01_08193 [Colletotrichum orchidophilum]